MIDTYKRKENIRYNGCNLNQWYGMVIVDESIEMDTETGIKQSANMSDTGALINLNRENFEFTLRFIRYDFEGKLSNFDQLHLHGTVLNEVNQRFFDSSTDVNSLEIGGKIYYVVCKGINHVRVNRNFSYLDVTFQSLSPYAYANLTFANYRVSEAKKVKLNNIGITKIFADVQIDCYRTGTVTIKNNGKTISVNCKEGDRVWLYGENADTSDYSKVSGDYKALELWYGVKYIDLDCTSGSDFEVTFQYQPELPM